VLSSKNEKQICLNERRQQPDFFLQCFRIVRSQKLLDEFILKLGELLNTAAAPSLLIQLNVFIFTLDKRKKNQKIVATAIIS
jgi:hypothetical protein